MNHFQISLYFVLDGALIIMWIRAKHMLKSYFLRSPLACHAVACTRPNFLDELARKRLLRWLATQTLLVVRHAIIHRQELVTNP